MTATYSGTPRYAVIECPTYSQAWDSHSFLCSFDMPSEIEYRGNFRACLRFITRQDAPFDFLIVYLRADDSFDERDIVWRPLDQDLEDSLFYRLANYANN